MERKIRIAIVVSHPIQHFIHLYRALSKEPMVELLVVYASDIGVRHYFDQGMGVEIIWNSDLTSGYSSIFLPEAAKISRTGFFAVNNPSVTKTLAEFRPDVVQLHGYAQLTLLRALAWCKLKRVPVLLWSDSSLLFQRNPLKSFTKKIILSLLMKQFRGVLFVGDNNKSYYRYYGVPDRKLFFCPFTVDEKAFKSALENKDSSKSELRKKYGVKEDDFLLVFVGKLIPLKRPMDILQALVGLERKYGTGHGVKVFFAGDGYLKNELQDFASEKNVPAVWGGFINIDTLPGIYAMADTLVFSSDREAYGLAAREAVCVGLPLIVSDQIGCVGPTDAARPDTNAFVYSAGDVDALVGKIEKLLFNPDLRSRMGAESLQVAGELSLKNSVAGFVSALKSVVK